MMAAAFNPKIALALLTFIARPIVAQPVESATIGTHYPVLRIEKNENPQNVLIAYVKLDEHCQILSDPSHSDRPFIGFYWLMEGWRFKPVHPILKHEILKRLQWSSQLEKNRYQLRIPHFDQLQPPPSTLIAHATRTRGCEVSMQVDLGSPAHPKFTRLTRIRSVSQKTFWPPFRRLVALTVAGEGPEGVVQETFRAR